MRKLYFCFALLLALISSRATHAQQNQQNSKTKTRLAIPVSNSYFASLGVHPKHTSSNKLSATAKKAAKNQDPRIVSVPTFESSFNFGGQNFPFIMVGHQPPHGTTNVATSYVPISFFFDEFIDQNGNNIVIDTTTITDEIKTSPVFENASYATGTTQFGDAQMRAEFFPLLKGNNDFHVLLDTPATLTPVTVEVPFGSSLVFIDGNGTFFALIDINFLASQINTLLQTESVSATAIPIFLTRNAVYGDFFDGEPLDCCIGGYHSAFVSNETSNKIFIQTFAFATALDSDVAETIFLDPNVFADVNALSHEMGEVLNDPFLVNVTPLYQVPGLPPGACDDFLEVGDVIVPLMPDYTDVTLHGFTYHPQTLALLQWFEGLTPSNAINGDYSFPDPTKLTSPFMACPVP